MTWNITIYGTNLYPPFINETYPLKSTIESQTDVETIVLEAISVNIKPVIEGEVTEYINRYKDFEGSLRHSFEIEFVSKFPDYQTLTDNFWGLGVIRKRYKYLWLNNYPFRTLQHNNEIRVIPIIITSFSIENNSGFKKSRIVCEESYATSV